VNGRPESIKAITKIPTEAGQDEKARAQGRRGENRPFAGHKAEGGRSPPTFCVRGRASPPAQHLCPPPQTAAYAAAAIRDEGVNGDHPRWGTRRRADLRCGPRSAGGHAGPEDANDREGRDQLAGYV
jgi:hypothetical protein